MRRRIRRSLRHGERWRLALDTCVTEVVGDCARSRGPDDGVWMSRR